MSGIVATVFTVPEKSHPTSETMNESSHRPLLRYVYYMQRVKTVNKTDALNQ